MTVNRFLELRVERGLSRKEVALGAGVSERTLTRIERGSRPSLIVLGKLSTFYEVSLVCLIAAAESDGDNR